MDKISTTGVIDQTIYSDGGNVMYIVNVELNGNIVKAQSIHYSSKTKSLPNGKKVSVNYWETPKGRNRLVEIIYVFLTIFLYLLKCPQSLILSALRAFCFCGKPHISRSIFLYFRYQAWLKSW